MEYAFYLGIDVTEDTSVLSLVEKEAEDTSAPAAYHVRRIEQFDLGGGDEDWPDKITSYVQDVLTDGPFTGRTVVVVNRTTDAGKALLDELDERGLTPLGVELASGEGAAGEEGNLFISEMDLAGRLVELHGKGQIEFSSPQDLPASELAQGIQRYRAFIDEEEATEEAEALGEAERTGDDAPEASAKEAGVSSSEVTETRERAVEYDPFTISAALACWFGEEHSFDPSKYLSEEIPDIGEVKRERRPDTTS